jgi:hypothetical protein
VGSVSDKADNTSKDVVVPNDAASLAFVQGLVERGEAVAASDAKALPPGATHIIVGHTESGHPIVKRVRFSAF